MSRSLAPSPGASARRRRPALAALAGAALLASVAPAAAVAQASSAAAAPSVGVVDIDTTLAYGAGEAAGTGMVIDPSGIVLTNNHVVEGASKITVRDVTSGRRYPATVLGTDSTDDVAALRLSGASGLTTVNLGSASSLHVGDAVRAVGNAGGTGGTPTVSSGRVVRRSTAITVSDEAGDRAEHLTGLIQVNASLSPGDSGGPLLNAAGQVVGMDTAASVSFRFQSRSQQGFAVPIDHALAIASQIRAGQGSARVHIGPAARLGVQVVASGLVPGSARGAVVAAVAAGTPADTLGLSRGDVIVSLGGHSVASPTILSDLIQQHHPGERVRVGWVDASGASRSAIAQLATGPAA